MITLADITKLENEKRVLVDKVDATNRIDLGHYERIKQGNALYKEIQRIEKRN